MSDLYDAAGDVSRGLMQLADDLREFGLTEQAGRCDAMSRVLSKALHDSLSETQPIVEPLRGKPK